MRKMRWLPHVIDGIPVIAYCEFVDPINDPLKIRHWANIAYVPEIDSYGASYMSKNRVQLFGDKPFDTISEAMTNIEQQLFEEGIRDDTKENIDA